MLLTSSALTEGVARVVLAVEAVSVCTVATVLERLISSEGCVVAAEEFVTATVEEAVAFSFLGFTVAAGCFLGVVTVTVFVSVQAFA
ncbi:hypothetical protein LCA02_13880 [Lacticaseibacillus casei]|nr:hypothetical protein LCA02_13880 [Lacticaseibacillus casei]